MSPAAWFVHSRRKTITGHPNQYTPLVFGEKGRLDVLIDSFPLQNETTFLSELYYCKVSERQFFHKCGEVDVIFE